MAAAARCCCALLLACQCASLQTSTGEIPFDSQRTLIKASVENEVRKFEEFMRHRGNTRPALTLLTSLFVPSELSHPHTVELFGALAVNLQNPVISEVHVLLESPVPAVDGCGSFPDVVARHAPSPTTDQRLKDAMHKVTCVPVERQPTYEVFFKYANDRLQNRTVLLSNTDVVFDSTLSLVKEDDLVRRRIGLVLAVQPPPYSGQYHGAFGVECLVTNRCTAGKFEGWAWGGNSWDAYIFHSPLPGPWNATHLDVVMNGLGAENLAAFEIERNAGVTLSNPCRHIHAFHWHCKGSKMHSEQRVDRDRGRNLNCIVPCWDCPGLRNESWPECRDGVLKDAKLSRTWEHHFSFPKTVQLCLAKSGQQNDTSWERTPAVCATPRDVNCVIPRGENVPHKVY